MATMKLVKIPEREIDFRAEDRTLMKRNAFLQLFGMVLEATPQHTDTETFLAHQIREKVDTLNGRMEIEMEESEISFMQGGIEAIRKQNAMTGSNWYYLIDPLRSAERVKKASKKGDPAE